MNVKLPTALEEQLIAPWIFVQYPQKTLYRGVEMHIDRNDCPQSKMNASFSSPLISCD